MKRVVFGFWGAAGAGLLAMLLALLAPAAAGLGKPKSPRPSSSPPPSTTSNFSFGQLQSKTVGSSGCGTNDAAEPAIHVSALNNVFLSSERGVGGGTDVWRGLGKPGGSGAAACDLEYRGQPNAVAGTGASGGDTDLAIGSSPIAAPSPGAGNYRVYVASLNLGSVAVANSSDNGGTFVNTPVQGGIPIDDRPWIAAFGANTSLLTYHDIASNDIDVLRSDNGGLFYAQVSQAIPASDYKASNNELGNIVIDRRNSAGTAGAPGGQPGFWAYQSFVAPSAPPSVNTKHPSLNSLFPDFNQAFVAVSNDGGFTWTDRPIGCSKSGGSLDHQFPNVSVAPNGSVWATWSDDSNVFAAVSTDHGQTWTCSGRVSTNTSQAVMPWLVATSGGVDLVYYGTTGGKKEIWSVYFAQNLSGTAAGWGGPQALFPVHQGSICEEGFTCDSGRQLFDDFGVDTDQQGWAHIAYSHDAPTPPSLLPVLGGEASYTGYAVQTAGTPVGAPN
jgi:hypothetical protein